MAGISDTTVAPLHLWTAPNQLYPVIYSTGQLRIGFIAVFWGNYEESFSLRSRSGWLHSRGSCGGPKRRQHQGLLFRIRLTWHGVTVYGTIDVGYAYQTNGRPLGAIVSDLEYMPFGLVTRNLTGQSISTLTANALEQSKIGVKIEEDIGYGLQAIGRLDTGFDPMSGELSNGCASVLRNSGIPYAQQNSNSDSARCGQAFNNVAYGGLSSPLYGTLTVGRQQSLQLETLGAYDPMALSYAFSVLGFSGAAAGMGSTQGSRWDNSVKYVFTYGPFHAAGMYSDGGSDTGMFGDAYGANVGVTYRGFSLDGVWTQEHGVVNLQSAANNLLFSQTLGGQHIG